MMLFMCYVNSYSTTLGTGLRQTDHRTIKKCSRRRVHSLTCPNLATGDNYCELCHNSEIWKSLARVKMRIVQRVCAHILGIFENALNVARYVRRLGRRVDAVGTRGKLRGGNRSS